MAKECRTRYRSLDGITYPNIRDMKRGKKPTKSLLLSCEGEAVSGTPCPGSVDGVLTTMRDDSGVQCLNSFLFLLFTMVDFFLFSQYSAKQMPNRCKRGPELRMVDMVQAPQPTAANYLQRGA